jgi:hypothetical protein
MVISPRLYVSDSLSKKQNKVIWRVRHGRKVLRLFIITGASNPDNQLDIYYYNSCFQKAYGKYYNLTVYGIAATRKEAFALVEQMVSECYNARGDADLNAFLND